MRRTIPMCVLAALAACSQEPSLYKSVKETYITSPEARQLAAESLPPVSRAEAIGVQANLIGSRSTVLDRLGPTVAAFGPVPAPDARRYVERIRDRLLSAMPPGHFATPPNVEIIALNNYSAEALSDATLQVNFGVLAQAKSDDEVAFVIGHELGHLLLQHQQRRNKTLNDTQTVAQTVTTLGMVAGELSRAKKSGQTLVISKGVGLTATLAKFGTDRSMAALVTTVIDPSWSARQEEQADLIGTDLTTAAGYNPGGAADVFANVIGEEEADKQRATEVSAVIKAQRKDKSTLVNLNGMFNDGVDWVEGRFDNFVANHPDTKARDQALHVYRDTFYGKEQDRPDHKDQLTSLQATEGYSRVKQEVEHVNNAMDALLENNNDSAVSEARQAHQLAPDWWAAYWIYAVALLADEQQQAGVKALLATTQLEGTPYAVYERTAFELILAKQYNQALQVLDAAGRRFGDPDAVLPDRIMVYRYMHNDSAVQSEVKKCVETRKHRLESACQEAAIRPADAPVPTTNSPSLTAQAGAPSLANGMPGASSVSTFLEKLKTNLSNFGAR